MILRKIIIDNIRSHKHLEFSPENRGITAIVGENGAGKSTILDSFAWCLFGIKPSGLKNSDFIREGVNPKEDLVQITAEISVAGSDYKITRRVMAANGTSYCHVYSRKNEDEEYNLECGPGVVHSETFIRKLLGYDAKGFLSASYIQQKQVDQIIVANARERSQVIEQLIGVSSITEAIKQSKDESKQLQNAASVIQLGSLEEENLKVKELQNKLEITKHTLEDFNKALSNHKEEYDIKLDLYNKEKEKQDISNELTVRISIIDNDIKNLNERQIEQLGIIESAGNVKFSEEKLVKLKQQGKQAVEDKKSIENTLLTLKARKSELDKIFSVKISDSIMSEKQDNSSKLQQAETTINKLTLEVGELKSKAKFSRDFYDELGKDIACCPMCSSEVKDKEKERVKVEQTIEFCKKEFSTKNKKLKENIELRDSLLNTAITIDKMLEIKIQQDSAKEEYNTVNSDIAQIELKLTTTQAKIQKLTEDVSAMNESKNSANLVTGAKATIKMLSERLKSLSKEKRDLEKELKKVSAKTKKEFSVQEKEKETLEKQLQKLEIDLVNREKELILDESKLQEALANLERCKKAKEEYDKLATRIETVNSTTKSLLEFKELRVRTSVPELSKLASDILSKFTNGEFIEYRLSDTFDSSVVTSTGQVRPVAQLSGGELSAAAIALRLAISVFLSEGSHSLLILDEVLVSMSEERSQLILETIASLPQSQIVMIAHSSILNSFADKVIEL